MKGKTQITKRRDKGNLVLRKGESQRANGGYDFRWTGQDGKRHSVYAKTLESLREIESQIEKDKGDGLRTETRNVTVNELFMLWKQLKRGLKDNTFQNYQYMYNMFVAPSFGKKYVSNIAKSDMKRFYNTLVDEHGLSVSTVDSIHTVLHQVFDMAVDDAYIRHNPSDNVLKELKQTHEKPDERRALTKTEQDRFLQYLKSAEKYRHWHPIFAVMLGTGMRVGEVIGLRWCDVDFDENMISVNHTLIYYKHEINGCYSNIHTPKNKKRHP